MDAQEITSLLALIDPTGVCNQSGDEWLSISCLFKKKHQHEDTSPSASISIIPNGASRYKCFACGITGELTSVLRKYKHYIRWAKGVIIDVEAVIRLAQEHNKDNAWCPPKEIKYHDRTNYYLAMKYPEGVVKKFLNNKGITEFVQVNMFRQHNKTNLAIPYFKDKRCIGMRFRPTTIAKAYYTIEELTFPTREVLWGSWQYEGTNPDVLFVTEGELDAAYIQQFELNAVAVGGTAWNNKKRDELVLNINPKSVVVAFDNDGAGINGKDKVTRSLKDYCYVRGIVLSNFRKKKEKVFKDEERKARKASE